MNVNRKLTYMVTLALLVALVFLLGQTPLGLIPLGFCNVTILVIPVAVGTIFLGWKSGLVLGAAFGATSLISALTHPSALVSTLMSASLPLAVVMTVVPRLVIPLVIAGTYRLAMKGVRRLSMAGKDGQDGKPRHVALTTGSAVAIASAAGSLTNTVLYLGLMVLFYMFCGIDNAKVLTTIAAVAGGAGPLEAIAAAIICPPVVAALKKVKR